VKWCSYRARWQGEEYPASVFPDRDGLGIRLYRTTPADGFDEVQSDRHVRGVPAAECETVQFVTTVCTWRGAPFQVHDERDDHLLVEYTGGELPVAQRLGLHRIERGVYRGMVPRAEVTELRENAVELSV
jgi:hypothetical protein